MSEAKPRVLFLCIANSARSQIAEGLARVRFGDRIPVASAGSAPSGVVHPQAIAMMAHRGLDLSNHRSKGITDVDTSALELVVTLCADEICPVLPGAPRRLHWPLPDPAAEKPRTEVPKAFEARAEEFLAASLQGPFRGAALAIEKRLDAIEPMFATPPGTHVGPASIEDRPAIEALLAAAGLPIDDIDQLGPHKTFADGFAVARLGGEVVGAAAVEWNGMKSLLRSVVVAERHRGSGIGEALVADRLCYARDGGVEALYLLTTGAQRYFERLGFAAIDRARLPSQLSHMKQVQLPACSTAIAMVKKLVEHTTDDQLDVGIAKELAEHGTLRPPWIQHPEIPRRSIGWRMGGGEWYLWMWHRWWEQQDAAARDAYRARWAVDAPAAWRDWLGETQSS